MNKTKIIILAVMGLLALIGYLAYRSFDLGTKLDEMEGKNVILKANIAKVKTEAEKDRAAANAIIAAKDASILEHQHKEVILERSLTAKDSDLSKLKDAFSLIQDCPGQVVNLRAQMTNLEQAKADQGQYILELQRERDDWHLKFDVQVNISESWKKQYLAEVALNTNLGVMTAQLKTDLWCAKFWSSSKTIIIIGEAMVVGYLIIKGK